MRVAKAKHNDTTGADGPPPSLPANSGKSLSRRNVEPPVPKGEIRRVKGEGWCGYAAVVMDKQRLRGARLRPDLPALGPTQHVLTDYGDEATETLPWDLFTQDSARQALALAERVLAQTRRILTLQEESELEDPPEPSAE